ncbi:Rossmann-like and DUF2520 domain-containing protein [Aridibaculum aurantiacum]|uniref:Rossmann-like and DUF2520 domain-containing protein n=1 Tax=Aridibaculum aurantiacum TaxID=2810307 RepID=UPI001A968232|nr:Rossmann-like and DUF2520 domain-containing protein [Aridibaculum aurantiacum]
MKVVIIGSGNVAWVLGKKMKQAGVEIIQVLSRNKEQGQQLAGILSTAFASTYSELSKKADLYMIAVSDTYISSVAAQLKLKNKIIVHTAGSVSKTVLQSTATATCSYGVLYPLQTLNKEAQLVPEVPVLIDGVDENTIQQLTQFAAIWSESVAVADDDQRLKMHIAAVFSSNFTTFMHVMADEYCTAEGLNFKMLLPLIEETSSRLKMHRPVEVQTGPAIRKDIPTINMHIDLLSSYPRLQGMYRLISASILDQ